MNKLFLAAAGSAACLAMAPAAQAATFVTCASTTCTFSEGVESGIYYQTVAKNTAFDIYYAVSLSSPRDFTVSLTASSDTSVINFTTRELLDSAFGFLGTFTSNGVMGALTLPLTSDVYYVHLIGSTGAGKASYSGTLDIAPIPEPATWALMIAGIATVGTALRRRSALARVSFS